MTNGAVSQDILVLHPQDNVAVARRDVPAGKAVRTDGPAAPVVTCEPIRFGHKVALRAIGAREPVIKYGQTIGFATRDIAPGQWVHTHNVEPGELKLDYAFATEVPAAPEPQTGRTFLGYRRADGRAATRNYVAVLSTVNCSATAARRVADRIAPLIRSDYPNIDGVVALTHKMGCAMEYGGEGHRVLARTLAGFARHPNVGACVILGLGCETAQPSYLVEKFDVSTDHVPSQPAGSPLILSIQDVGGLRKTVERTVDAIKSLLPDVNRVEREPIPVSELIVGTECGGSDANSGITANPALGVASDRMVAHGGTVILAEVPEICGGEHLLTRRVVSRKVGEALIERIRWWRDYVAKFGGVIDNNPSVGNREGGLTTIYEKSLGAIAKGGHTALRAVVQYAEPVTTKGLVVMDTPGFDAISVTGMVAGGAHVIVFTTGRGSCFGCKPVPTIKVATNSALFHHLSDDMDINAGRILEDATVEEVGEEIFEEIVAVASGKRTKSEEQGIGDEEFCPWQVGPIL
ncbi:MAG TPA: altronate dehydratase [Planctomycetaceae bacterium]|nr:altronate dehydratase [Planctomycetaceae bacterium]